MVSNFSAASFNDGGGCSLILNNKDRKKNRWGGIREIVDV